MKNLIIFSLVVLLIASLTSCKGSRDTLRYNKRQDKEVWHKWSKDKCPQAYREP
jgi:hypothetical protein